MALRDERCRGVAGERLGELSVCNFAILKYYSRYSPNLPRIVLTCCHCFYEHFLRAEEGVVLLLEHPHCKPQNMEQGTCEIRSEVCYHCFLFSFEPTSTHRISTHRIPSLFSVEGSHLPVPRKDAINRRAASCTEGQQTGMI